MKSAESDVSKVETGLIISIVFVNVWKTRCTMIIKQTVIDNNMVIKHVLT